MLRPDDDHCFGGGNLRLDALSKIRPGTNVAVPPDGESRFGESARQWRGARPVVACIGEENVGYGPPKLIAIFISDRGAS